MSVIPGDVIIEPATNRHVPQSQPVQALAGLDPVLDDAAVRQAIASAEANNQDPQTLTIGDLAQVPVDNPAVPLSKPPEVPQKFLKPDGEVDVDKLQASTRQLDEAIQKRDPVPQKTVDDYLAEYREKEKLFRSGTVPKPAESALPLAPVPQREPTTQEFEEIVRRDYAADPLATTTRLLDLMLEKKFAPIAEREKTEMTRSNLQALAAKDARILNPEVFSAVNAKLASDPDLWKLKNPHKAAWLEVKEEMRLGDPAPNGTGQAQPSRSSPVLGGGTPPSAPSTSAQSAPTTVAALNTLDLRDKKQEAAGDEAIRALLAANR